MSPTASYYAPVASPTSRSVAGALPSAGSAFIVEPQPLAAAAS